MSLRLIEAYIPAEDEIIELDELEGVSVLGRWQYAMEQGRVALRILVEAGQSEETIDQLEKYYSQSDGFRLIVMPVEAVLPRPAEPDPPPEQTQASDEPAAPAKKKWVMRVSREELRVDLDESATLTPIFVITVIISAIVAAVGLVRDNVAIVVAAMVIAPLLGPNMALSLSTTLGDGELARKSLRSLVVGVAVALVFSIVVGMTIPFAGEYGQIAQEIIARTQVSYGDIVLAIASGCAGVMAFTTAVPASLIGVMVAVALLPPLVVCGLFIGVGNWPAAGGAALLLATNLICVNLAGVVTFLSLGVHPRKWWEAKKARQMAYRMIVVWVILLAILAGLIALGMKG